MTKNQILAELMQIERMIASHKRGEGSLTAMKAYQRRLYKQYIAA